MKKRWTWMAAALAVMLCLAGCGAKTGETEVPSAEQPAQAASAESMQAAETEPAEAVSEWKDAAAGQVPETHNGALVLHSATVLEKEGVCRAENAYAELLTDRAVDMQWDYVYMDSHEEGAKERTWAPAEGLYATGELIVDLTNLGTEPAGAGGTVSARVVFDEGGAEKTYPCTRLQTKPGTVGDEAFDFSRAEEPLDVPAGEGARFWFLFDVDREFHDAVVSGDGRPVWGYIELENGDRFCMDLTEDMVCFGYDDSDDESRIVADVHNMMEEATGEAYLTEFLGSAPEFLKVVELTGISVEQTAKDLAPRFDIRVEKIEFVGDDEACAVCTVTAPDFITMYKQLDEISASAFSNVDPLTFTEEDYYRESGKLFADFLTYDTFPLSEDPLYIQYRYDAGNGQWTAPDRENVMNRMRIAMINF